LGSARLKKLYVKNFLSLRDVSVEFGKLNVLIGPNASGKSNLLKALRLLRNHVRVGLPVLDEKSPTELPFGDLVYGFDVYKTIELKAVIDYEGREVSYELRLSMDGYEEAIEEDSETVYEYSARLGGIKRGPRYRASDGTLKDIPTRPTKIVTIAIRDVEGRLKRMQVDYYSSPLSFPPGDVDMAIRVVIEFLRGIGVFRFDPAALRFSSRVVEEPVVEYSGANLARFLLHLYLERRRDFIRVEDAVKAFVPEVDEVIPHIEGDSVELWIRFRGLPLPLRPDYVSDGTLRLLAIASILGAGFSLVAIEEPENHVHPHLLEALVDLAKSSPSQVVFTTHSPHLLDYVEPSEVLVVGRVGLETRIRRLTETREVEAVKRFLEEGGTLGEAWYAKLFGEVE